MHLPPGAYTSCVPKCVKSAATGIPTVISAAIPRLMPNVTAFGCDDMAFRSRSFNTTIEKRFKPLERTDEPDLKDEDVKEILHDVLTELYYSKGNRGGQDRYKMQDYGHS
ncbi:MAG: hypothetical protein WAM14_26350 [Candidatus Nitrosopolaris sp.]